MSENTYLNNQLYFRSKLGDPVQGFPGPEIIREKIAFHSMVPRPNETFRSFYTRLSSQASKCFSSEDGTSTCADEWIQGRLIQLIPDEAMQLQLATMNKDVIQDVLAKLDGNQEVATT